MRLKFSCSAGVFLVFLSLCILLMACERSETIEANWHHLSSINKEIPAPGPSRQQTASLVFDVDMNGSMDFIIGSRKSGPSVLFYRRIGTGWIKYTIEKETLPVEAGGAYADIDQDGDPDIVFGADYSDNKMWWWENPFPAYDAEVPWKRHEIKASGSKQHHDQVIADFDGDGLLELVTWNQGGKGEKAKLLIADIPQDPQAANEWNFVEIFSSEVKCEGLAAVDVDLDGMIDIVGGGHWFKYVGGTRFKSNTIDEEQRFARTAVGQLVAGGRPEVVFAIGDGSGPLKWYQWLDDRWQAHRLLDSDVDHGHSLQVADMNGDGQLDIFCGEMRLNGDNKNAKMWLFLGDGAGHFKNIDFASGFGVHEAKVGDLDGDGDIDILGKPYNWDTPRLDIWLDETGPAAKLSLDSWKRHVIDHKKPWRSVFITAADIDGDGLKDVITGGWWYKNPGMIGGSWQRKEFGSPLRNMAAVYDFDGDGDLDVLGTQGKGAKASSAFAWARNDGPGKFDVFQNISDGDGDFLQGVAVGSFEKSDSVSVALSWHAAGKGIQMVSVPEDVVESRWPISVISRISQDECLSAGDIDRDGDVDLLMGTKWLRNEEKSWTLMEVFKSSDAPDRNRLCDINGDGRLDAVVGYEAISKKGKLAWYEQPVALTDQWQEHVIDFIVGPMSLDVADMDGDGDVDVIVGEHNLKNPAEAKLIIFENGDGKGGFWKQHIVSVGDEHHDGARVFDLDGDGDMDIVSIGWGHDRVLVYENLSR